MTELTDDQVRALLAHYDLPTDCDCDGDDCVKCSHYPMFQERAAKKLKELAPDLARALLDARAELAAAQQREAALTKALEACVASLERVDTAEGVCCCGDSMDRHSDPMSCGHSPVDMGDYYAGQALESARAALAQTPTDPGDGWTWNERLGWIGPDGRPVGRMGV